MMIAKTSNAANNERARSNDFDRGFAASSGMSQFPISTIFGACLFSGRSTHGYRQRIEASQFF
jgi:hypothetical protein